MKTGPAIHGALLVAALLVAYQTWTREEKVEPKTGAYTVWTERADSLQAITLETPDRTVRVERRGAGADAHLWGTETTSRKAPRPPRPPVAEGEEPPPPPPEPETVHVTREFPVGTGGDDAFANLSALRALRELAELSDERKEEYGLADSTDQLSASFAGKTRTLILGGKVHGGSDRYALDPDSGRAYVIAGPILQPLERGEAGLRLQEIHAFDDDDLTGAVVVVGERERALVRTTVADDQGTQKTWADAASPNEANLTMANFIDRISKLRPTRYESDIEVDDLELLVRVDYRTDAGKPPGWFELYRTRPADAPAPAPEPGAEAPPEPGAEAAPPTPDNLSGAGEVQYYVRTERTYALGAVSKIAAERIDQDLAQIFAP
jgi:hypothetical protein